MTDYPLAVVTGGAHRLGRAFSLTLAYEGYAVLVHYHRSAQQAAKTVAEIKSFGVPAFSMQADLTQPEHVGALFELADSLLAQPEAPLSHLAVLVNSAAVIPRGAAQTLPLDAWDATLDLNLRAPFLCAQQASRRMTRGGLIVNVSDVGAEKAWSRFPSYTVSKAALESLTRVLARAFAPEIRVNTIAPGLVLHSDIVSEEEWKKLIQRVPLKRKAESDEIGSALQFLLDNEYVTGQTIIVDGGYSLV
jgi:NAD(P)-dependent dehydrogenase (short-subunit alcohol dehydrogenase family)